MTDSKKNNSRAIGIAYSISCWAVKGAYKGAKLTAKTIYDHRNEIGGACVGIVQGTAELAQDIYGHTIREQDYIDLLNVLKRQSKRYQELTSNFYGKNGKLLNSRRMWVDSLVIGADFTGQYAFANSIADDVQQAYELAYPRLSETKSLIEAINGMDDAQLQGLMVGIKGKLFELKYADYLNNGHLPDGYSAHLAKSATNSGWDIAIVDDRGMVSQNLQLKATDSVDYICQAFEKYPHIDIVTTDEVYSHIAMQGFSEHVINSGIDDQVLTDIVNSSLTDSTLNFDLMPSIIPFALIAFSVSRQQDLTDFQKGKQFGERSSKSCVSYLAGGAVAVVSHTWWLGLIAAVGSRTLLGMGRNKRERLRDLKDFVANNERVLRRIEVVGRRYERS